MAYARRAAWGKKNAPLGALDSIEKGAGTGHGLAVVGRVDKGVRVAHCDAPGHGAVPGQQGPAARGGFGKRRKRTI